eukprot:TRINITY_DN4179_c0_g2_i2.p1 TRINITY_DN4179_c0_g2~~TRINITY_DN4179_c0_g2_i2.p1  ORF type:complete len:319 (-),score=71.29 TRINITY_DN4179_c0_g2_i2:449-1354(-)
MMWGGIEYSANGQCCQGDESVRSFTTDCSDNCGGSTRNKLSWADIRDSDSEDESSFYRTNSMETTTPSPSASVQKLSSDVLGPSEPLPRLLGTRSPPMSGKPATKSKDTLSEQQRRARSEPKQQQQKQQKQPEQSPQSMLQQQSTSLQPQQQQKQQKPKQKQMQGHEQDRRTPYLRQSPEEFQEKGIDTVMIRNLDSRMKQSELFELLKSYGFEDLYCFLYMPRSLETKKAKGYAFVVFDTSGYAADCMCLMHGEMVYGSKLDISAAVLQGFDTNVKKWCSRGSRIKSPELKPYIRPNVGS